jgi:hypothetical protein
MVTSSQQPPESGSWAPFSCSWGTEGGPTGPRTGARHTLQHGRPPSSGTWGALLLPSGRLAGTHKQSVPRSGGKSNWRWKIAERCQLMRRTASVRLQCTLRCVFSSPELKAQVSYSDRLLSVVRPSVHLSVNFYIFDFFSRTTGPILTKFGTNHP